MRSPEAEIEHLQARLLDEFPGRLSPAVREAFRAVPRHVFVRHYWSGDRRVEVTADNLRQQLPILYRNGTLQLWSDQAQGVYSTISQPTLVLGMLEQLRLAPGQSVFELGAGSGWNAALLGRLVGPAGRVHSVEIIPELAAQARASLAALNIDNVHILSGDGSAGYPQGAPFDRAVFTAGTYDLPAAFHEQVRRGGLLQVVLKVRPGEDQLHLLEKTDEAFESRRACPCAFVPMVGDYDSSGAPVGGEFPPLGTVGHLRIYPAGATVCPREGERLIRRRGSQFVWSVK